MKVIRLLVILFFFFLIVAIPAARTKASHGFFKKKSSTAKRDTNFNALTKADRLKYDLAVNLSKPVAVTCEWLKKGFTIYKVNVHLQNNSKDTLKYIDWYCSSEVWNINNGKLIVSAPFEVESCGGCDKNMITYYEVPPHENKALYVFVSSNNKSSHPEKFKIGMILQRIIKKSDFYIYDNYFKEKNNLKDQKMNIIWSNSIVMP